MSRNLQLSLGLGAIQKKLLTFHIISFKRENAQEKMVQQRSTEHAYNQLQMITSGIIFGDAEFTDQQMHFY